MEEFSSPGSRSNRPGVEACREVAIVFHARDGGVQQSQVTLANALCRSGIAVSLVMPKAEGPFLARRESGVELVDLGVSSHLSCVLAFRRFLRRRRPSCVLVSQHHTGVLFLLAQLLAGTRCRTAVMFHNHMSTLVQGERWGRALVSLMRVLLPRAELTFAVSSGVADDLRLLVPRIAPRIQVAYNAVSISEIRRLATARVPEELLAARRLGPVLVSVGRLAPQKDFAALLRAMVRVRQRFGGTLFIVGDGPCRSELSTLAVDLGLGAAIRLMGAVENPYPLMRFADGLVVSSRWEGLPLVIIEALALGRPVISTDCPSGPAEILEHGRYGDLVPVGDDERLAEAMCTLIDAGSNVSELERLNRARDFAPERSVQPFLRWIAKDSEAHSRVAR